VGLPARCQESVAEEYDLGGMPSLYLIDKKGALRYRHDGYSERDEKSIDAEIKASWRKHDPGNPRGPGIDRPPPFPYLAGRLAPT